MKFKAEDWNSAIIRKWKSEMTFSRWIEGEIKEAIHAIQKPNLTLFKNTRGTAPLSPDTKFGRKTTRCLKTSPSPFFSLCLTKFTSKQPKKPKPNMANQKNITKKVEHQSSERPTLKVQPTLKPPISLPRP